MCLNLPPAAYEEFDFRAIERASRMRISRMTLPEFDYKARSTERLEVPLAERIAAIRARKAEERARSRAKAGVGARFGDLRRRG